MEVIDLIIKYSDAKYIIKKLDIYKAKTVKLIKLYLKTRDENIQAELEKSNKIMRELTDILRYRIYLKKKKLRIKNTTEYII